VPGNRKSETRGGPRESSGTREEATGLAALRGRLLSFSGTERRVARYIVAHAHQVGHLSMAEIAAECGVSDTTVLRTCRHAGFRGFSDLKIAIIKETANSTRIVPDDVARGDTFYTVAHKVFQEEIQALYDTLELLSEKKLATVVDLVEKARRILIVGVGQSSIMGQAFCTLRPTSTCSSPRPRSSPRRTFAS